MINIDSEFTALSPTPTSYLYSFWLEYEYKADLGAFHFCLIERRNGFSSSEFAFDGIDETNKINTIRSVEFELIWILLSVMKLNPMQSITKLIRLYNLLVVSSSLSLEIVSCFFFRFRLKFAWAQMAFHLILLFSYKLRQISHNSKSQRRIVDDQWPTVYSWHVRRDSIAISFSRDDVFTFLASASRLAHWLSLPSIRRPHPHSWILNSIVWWMGYREIHMNKHWDNT